MHNHINKIIDAVDRIGHYSYLKRSLFILHSIEDCHTLVDAFRESYTFTNVKAKIDRWGLYAPNSFNPFCTIVPVSSFISSNIDIKKFDDVFTVGEEMGGVTIFGEKAVEDNKKPHRKLPPLAIALCFDCDGWIVGSTADYAAGKESDLDGRDLDIVIPAQHWNKASHICCNADKISINSFGGFKCVSDGVEIDVWMDDVGSLMSNDHVKSAFHPKSRTYIKREKL